MGGRAAELRRRAGPGRPRCLPGCAAGTYPPCAVMWRRESFSRFGPWPEQLRLGVNDDGLLMMRALCRGADFRERTDGVSYYRRLPASGSLSSRRREREGLLDRAEVLAEVRGCLKETGQLRGCRKSLRSAYLTLAADAAGQNDLVADYRGAGAGPHGHEYAGRRCRSGRTQAAARGCAGESSRRPRPSGSR